MRRGLRLSERLSMKCLWREGVLLAFDFVRAGGFVARRGSFLFLFWGF